MRHVAHAVLLREEKRDQLPEGEVQHENQADHDDQRRQHHRGVVDELGAGRPRHLAHLVSHLADELHGRRALAPLLSAAWLALRARGRPRGRLAGSRGPIGLHLPLALHHALGLAVHDSCLTYFVYGWLRPGQGRRDSNPQPPVLETGALPVELLPSVGCLRLPSSRWFFPLTWGSACQSSTGKLGVAQRVSLCSVCWRSQRQNFFISIRSRSFSLFLVVM